VQDAGEDGFDERVGSKLREAREAIEWSQRRLAEELEQWGLKLDPSAVTRIERGSREVKLREAVAFAEALGIPIQELATPPTRNPRAALESYLGSAWERMDTGRHALAGMAYFYMMASNLLDEHPEILQELATEKGITVTDSMNYLALEAYSLGEQLGPLADLAVDDEHLELIKAIIAASVANVVQSADDDEL
jgi:transcriptional regulator with XRE-family HTH domain